MTRSRLKLLAPFAFGFLISVVGVNCRVALDDTASYTCTKDTDCGGGGFTCVTRANGVQLCCQRKDETCDGLDNDCNGAVDDLPPCFSGTAAQLDAGGECRSGTRRCVNGAPSNTCENQVIPRAEICNGKDDDCDGLTDETFSLQTSLLHCGACNNGCDAGQGCVAGACRNGVEVCDDAVDNDFDGLNNCQDPDCTACGTGCGCLSDGGRFETSCTDGADNDGDGQLDCADGLDCPDNAACQPSPATAVCAAGGCSCLGLPIPQNEAAGFCGNGLDDDCDGVSDCLDPGCDLADCDAGCSCAMGSARETLCADGLDNDGDGSADCADGDCPNGGACTQAPLTFTCAGNLCQCNGSVTPGPESLCSNGADDDCDSTTDCQDPSCAGLSCGAGCECRGLSREEAACGDQVDNDTDLATDCLDQGCDGGVYDAGSVCLRGRSVEQNCRDGVDNDGDGNADCADLSDCGAQLCQSAPSSFVCAGGNCACNGSPTPPPEATSTCGDSQDNDCDGLVDCMDSSCDGGTCAVGCQCQRGGGRRETNCVDMVDNDGDGPVSCQDSDCFGAGCGAGCSCAVDGGGRTETNCDDDLDNDGQGGMDCADVADCLGQACTFNVVLTGTCRANGACN